MNTTRQLRSTVLGLFVGLVMLLTAAVWGSGVPSGNPFPGTYHLADGENNDDSGWG